MKLLPVVILMLVFGTRCSSQAFKDIVQKLDSTAAVVMNMQQPIDEKLVDQLNFLGAEYHLSFETEKADSINEIALKYARQLNYQKGIVEGVYTKARIFSRFGSNEETAEQLYKEGLLISETINYSSGIGKGNLYLSMIKRRQSKYDETESLLQLALIHLDKETDNQLVALVYMSYGHLYGVTEDPRSLEYYEMAMRLMENDPSTHPYRLLSVYRNISIYYTIASKNSNKKWEYINKANDIAMKSNHPYSIHLIRENIAYFYFTAGNFTEAIEIYNELINRNIALNSEKRNSALISILGYCHLQLNQFDQAKRNALNAVELFKTEKDTTQWVNSLVLLALSEYNLNTGNELKICTEINSLYQSFSKRSLAQKHDINLELAPIYLKYDDDSRLKVTLPESLQFFKGVNDLELTKKTLLLLKRLYKRRGNFRKALFYEEQVVHINDSLNSQKYSAKISDLKVKHGTETLTVEKTALQKEGQIQQMEILNNKKRIANQNLVIIGSALILGLLSLFLVYYKRFSAKTKFLMENIKFSSKKIETQNQHLEKLNNLKNTFINIISHDYRRPLITIKNVLNKALIENSEDEIKNVHHITMNQEVDKALTLIDQLLYWSSVEISNSEQTTYQSISLLELLNGNIAALDYSIKTKSITIESNLYNSDINAKISADVVNFTLRNILSNAIKHSPFNGIIKILVNKNEEVISFMISDEGEGLDLNKKESIFNTDQQHLNPKNNDNLGIGLQLVKKVLDKYGGSISVKSHNTKGANFTFTLPL